MADNNRHSIVNNQDGFVLVLSILIMVVLVVIGVTSVKTSKTELEIAGNEKVHKQTFYDAEAGISVAIETLWLNYSQNNNGFPTSTLGDNVTAVELNPWQNSAAIACPSDADRDILYSFTNDDSDPHTNINVSGTTVYGTGSALQMAAGYEGVGKGASGGGTHKLFDIYTQRYGYRESESNVQIQWRFVP